MRTGFLLTAFLFFSICVNAQTDSSSDKTPTIFTFVEENPKFPGGEIDLVKFIFKHTKYPASQRGKGVNGKVMVRFVIEIDGSVQDVKVIQSLGPDFDTEAIRVVKTLPKFIPGKQQGKPVKVYYNLPVRFYESE